MSGLYIHSPFCRSKCVYCDFNSHAGLDELFDAHTEVLLEQIERDVRTAPDEWIETVFFGGGNPALLGPRLLEILEQCRRHRRIVDLAEVSIEMNPEDASLGTLRELRDGGFNRLSLGWQTLDDARLRILGRRHDARTAIRSLAAARDAGFDNVNVDLIFGLPGHRLDEWEHELEQIVALGPEHISTYALGVEPGTPLYSSIDELPPLPPEDEVADMYAAARAVLKRAGYEHYEISNFARPGYRCRHNLNYWRGGDYQGFGAGAHSHFQGHRWWNVEDPAEFVAATDTVAGSERLNVSQRLSERIFLGLRLVDGVEPALLEREFAIRIDDRYAEPLGHWRALGLLERGPRLALTDSGLALANEVMMDFV